MSNRRNLTQTKYTTKCIISEINESDISEANEYDLTFHKNFYEIFYSPYTIYH